MYLTKKQVTPVPKYFYGNEFMPPNVQGFYTWVLPEGVDGWSRDIRGAGGGGSNTLGGDTGASDGSKIEYQSYWVTNYGWRVKAITVWIGSGGAPGSAGNPMWTFYTPYIPLPNIEPSDPCTYDTFSGGAAGNQSGVVGRSQGSWISIDGHTIMDLGQGGQISGARGDPACGGAAKGQGGSSWCRFSTRYGSPTVTYKTSLDSSLQGEDVVMLDWPTSYQYADIVVAMPGSGGQGGSLGSAGKSYLNGWINTTRYSRTDLPTARTIMIIPGKPGKGGAVGGYWGGMGTGANIFVSALAGTPSFFDIYNNNVAAKGIRNRIVPDKTSGQYDTTRDSVTFQGRTYQLGSGPGIAPGRSGQGGAGGLFPTRGQDGAQGQVWWNIHN